MFFLKVLAAISLRGVAYGAIQECRQGATCTSDASDHAAMIQLGRVSAEGQRAMNVTGRTIAQQSSLGNSMPWFPPLAGPAPLQQPLIINEDGVENKYYLPGATIIDDGKTVKYEPPYRFYLMKTPTSDYSKAENFYMAPYMDKTFTVDIDFKKNGPGCGCNLNFYLVQMPAETPGKDKDYYCDAQCFPDLGCCPEFDMNEGNKEVQQVTNHACTGKGSYPNHPDWQCNKWGDPEVKTHPSDFNPGPGHTIDTDKPFTYSQKFDSNGGNFIFTTTMTQGDRSVVLTMGPDNAQLNNMMKDIENGMVFVTGYWYDTAMNWMDGETCGQGPENCNKNPAYISNWRLTSNGKTVPTPAPPPTPFVPTPPPPPATGKCCYNDGCSGCNPEGTWCSQAESNCVNSCGGKWCLSN